ncbi:MAG: hypothetical protein JEZ08_04585 [Clostridiales bacterium]|nr:hypothetical protein [Clostridiales bacterium]
MNDYIHLGSTKKEVTILLGEPSKINNNLWTYGSSHIKFNSNGEVIAWKNMFDDLSKAMKPFLSSDYTFFLGSTTDEVLQALGSPTAVIEGFESVWRYEASHVKFDGKGCVIEWKSVYRQLEHGLKKRIEGSDFIRIGSTSEEVLQALGSPDTVLALDQDVWHYKASHIKFRNNKVVEWRNQYRQLNEGMKSPEESHYFLNIGSTEEEVLTTLGSPTEILVINPHIWKYGASHVIFENGRVIAWKSVYHQLDEGLKAPNYNDYIRIGMSKEEILDIYGSPSSILKLDPDIWHYDTSHIKFNDNKVCEWRNMFRDLEKGFKKGDPSAEDVKIGVSGEVVLNRLGSPTCILEKEPFVWHYGNASVYFSSDMIVTSWLNIDDIKKHVDSY